MTESAVCLGSIKEVKLELSSEDTVSITDNPLECNKFKFSSKVDIENPPQLYMQNEKALQLHQYLVKEEKVKEEFGDYSVKTENILLTLNTDIPSSIEECIPLNILYCYHCNYGTNDKQNLTVHIFAHRLKCNQCNYTTPDYSMLMFHQQIHLIIGYSQCKVEQELSTNEEACQQLSLSEGLFECHDCGYRTNGKSTLKLHTRICLNGQISKAALQKHIQIIKCERCGYSASNLTDLTQHLFYMHGIKGKKKHKCKLCNFVAFYKSKLKIHERIHTRDKRLNPKPVKCNLCNYSCYYPSNLVKHYQSHSEERQFKCCMCDYTSKRSYNLKVHLSKHSGELSFSCPKCDYKTHSRHNLNTHVMTHSEEKSFKCSLCEFSSKRETSLINHSYTHLVEKSFSCDKCDYKTHVKRYLNKHLKKHRENEQFKCKLCEYCFYNLSSLKSHMLKHSSVCFFSCDKCDYKTHKKKYLTGHVKIHYEKR